MLILDVTTRTRGQSGRGDAAPRGLQIEGFSPQARDKLLAYDFPGNARELRYLVERAAILCRSGRILPEHLSLPETSVTPSPPESKSPNSKSPNSESPDSTEEQERTRILSALEETHWNRRDGAQILAIPYSTIRYRMQKLGIKK